jgi:hypothetical protein
MKLIPLAIIVLMWFACGIGDKKDGATIEQPRADQPVAEAPVQDREAVRKELISLANRIATAAKDGDVSYLAGIATDDFQLTDVDGKVKSKNKALSEVQEERNIRSFELTDEKLVSLDESTAVLSYTLKVYGKNGRSARALTTDTYVRQNGRWLIKSEQQTLLK